MLQDEHILHILGKHKTQLGKELTVPAQLLTSHNDLEDLGFPSCMGQIESCFPILTWQQAACSAQEPFPASLWGQFPQVLTKALHLVTSVSTFMIRNLSQSPDVQALKSRPPVLTFLYGEKHTFRIRNLDVVYMIPLLLATSREQGNQEPAAHPPSFLPQV